jgi:ABC-2 type transport system ATP-binding protein
VLLSSHLIGEMALTADRLVVIGRGRLLAELSMPELAREHTSLEDVFMALTHDSVEYRADNRSPGPKRAAVAAAETGRNR